MRVLKEYKEFDSNGYYEETSDMEQSLDIRDSLLDIEIDMELEIDNLDNSEVVINHTDMQKHYPKSYNC
jgi:hypothetical protein